MWEVGRGQPLAHLELARQGREGGPRGARGAASSPGASSWGSKEAPGARGLWRDRPRPRRFSGCWSGKWRGAAGVLAAGGATGGGRVGWWAWVGVRCAWSAWGASKGGFQGRLGAETRFFKSWRVAAGRLPRLGPRKGAFISRCARPELFQLRAGHSGAL